MVYNCKICKRNFHLKIYLCPLTLFYSTPLELAERLIDKDGQSLDHRVTLNPYHQWPCAVQRLEYQEIPGPWEKTYTSDFAIPCAQINKKGYHNENIWNLIWIVESLWFLSDHCNFWDQLGKSRTCNIADPWEVSRDGTKISQAKSGLAIWPVVSSSHPDLLPMGLRCCKFRSWKDPPPSKSPETDGIFGTSLKYRSYPSCYQPFSTVINRIYASQNTQLWELRDFGWTLTLSPC